MMQFIDAVCQIQRQFLTSFEFNETFFNLVFVIICTLVGLVRSLIICVKNALREAPETNREYMDIFVL